MKSHNSKDWKGRTEPRVRARDGGQFLSAPERRKMKRGFHSVGLSAKDQKKFLQERRKGRPDRIGL